MSRSAAIVRITASAAAAVRHGHPWVYRDQIDHAPSAKSGDWVRVEHDRTVLGVGLYDSVSPLAVRIWTLDDAEPSLGPRIDRAFAWRDSLFSSETTNAFRCIHGEGDRLPGFVVDRYDTIAVLRPDGDGARARLDWMRAELWPRLKSRGIVSLVLRDPDHGARVVEGSEPSGSIEVREHGVPMLVDVMKGQKTGAFLDQRENRRRVGGLARGRRVLNLFSYAGGFSLHAVLGGATHTTSVDSAMAAHKSAQDSFRLAGIDPAGHAFACADAFAFLDEAKKSGKKWDLVISDPPSFAPKESAKPRALTAYRRLHHACADLLADGGVFCAASCSSHVTERDFVGTLDDAALGRSDLSLREVYGPPADHPSLPGWPEGRYLKFAVLS
jgi:23S rRNA (cytosine1962-C5)-methyltransferase